MQVDPSVNLGLAWLGFSLKVPAKKRLVSFPKSPTDASNGGSCPYLSPLSTPIPLIPDREIPSRRFVAETRTLARHQRTMLGIMGDNRRTPNIHHCTSIPWKFFGRTGELARLNEAVDGGDASLLAMMGPGGQGKTAIVQHWLGTLTQKSLDGLFLWSFYRGKDSDSCLRHLLAYAERRDAPPEVSASFCVDRLLPILRSERWAIVFDGTEVVQHEQGSWHGRFVHPELGRLLEEIASYPMPGVMVVTTRFPLPTLTQRRFARVMPLSTLDVESACSLLKSLGVQGSNEAIREAAIQCGLHAKAVELLGTLLVHFHGGAAEQHVRLPNVLEQDASDEERSVARILSAFHAEMEMELKDIVALATSFRQPATERSLLDYLRSEPLRTLLHGAWKRTYEPFAQRPEGWLSRQVQTLVDLRLLERVGQEVAEGEVVLDAHPLVRAGFEPLLHGTAGARAGFLRGRPDRRPPRSLEETREEVELFHAYAEAGLWNEADGIYTALDNPKHRFLAPAFERDLLLRFFPKGDWRQKPMWAGFGRYRSLAICFEMLGQFEDALDAYPASDAPLRGDALLALGRLEPFLAPIPTVHHWQSLWSSYRVHALALAGRADEALRVAQTLVPLDVYEWVHLFEGLFRLDRLDLIDLNSLLYTSPLQDEHRWNRLARLRMKADFLRWKKDPDQPPVYDEILDSYERGGLPFERVLTRLSYARWELSRDEREHAQALLSPALELCQRHGMKLLEIDVLEILEVSQSSSERRARIASLRAERNYLGPPRP